MDYLIELKEAIEIARGIYVIDWCRVELVSKCCDKHRYYIDVTDDSYCLKCINDKDFITALGKVDSACTHNGLSELMNYYLTSLSYKVFYNGVLITEENRKIYGL